MKVTKKDMTESLSAPKDVGMSCCKVESIIAVDERGQMVLPKEIRERANIHAGDKFAVISLESGGKLCCISLIRTDDFADMVKGLLSPVMNEMLQK